MKFPKCTTILCVCLIVIDLTFAQNVPPNANNRPRPPFRPRRPIRNRNTNVQRIPPNQRLPVAPNRPRLPQTEQRPPNRPNPALLNRPPPPSPRPQPRPQPSVGNVELPVSNELPNEFEDVTEIALPSAGLNPIRPPPPVLRPPRQPQERPSLPGAPNRNLPPVLLEGHDLIDFSIREDTPINSEVYTLRGQDPEGSKVFYTISGDFFSVNRESGVIRLREPLDREHQNTIEVVITIQDEAFNLIPFRREIRGKRNLAYFKNI